LGCRFAAASRVRNVEAGREKWREEGLEAWRRRQRFWISEEGRDRILEKSRKELRVFIPGGGAGSELDGAGEDAGEDVGEGGGGGGGYGDEEVGGAVSVGFRGAVTPGTAASFRSDSIFSL